MKPGDPRRRRIRKQCSDLDLRDLRRCPVWEYADDEEGVEGQDECTVRPVAVRAKVRLDTGSKIVRTNFLYADGTPAVGYIMVSMFDSDDLSSHQPTILTRGGGTSFWCGCLEPSAEHIEREYAALGKARDAVFPIVYETDVPIAGGPVGGVIRGFGYMASSRGGRMALRR